MVRTMIRMVWQNTYLMILATVLAFAINSKIFRGISAI